MYVSLMISHNFKKCLTGDPLYIVKIVIGPIICFILLLLVSVTGFVMFKKKYANLTLIFFHSDSNLQLS